VSTGGKSKLFIQGRIVESTGGKSIHKIPRGICGYHAQERDK